MAKPQKKKGGKGGKMVRRPSVPAGDPQLAAAAAGLQKLANENPEGWGMIAEILRDSEEIEADVMLEFLARHLGKEVLPLLRGAALDEDEEFALAALHALPLLGTRAAGEVLAEAFHAHSDGERGKAARQGVESLQARGINVSLPETGEAPSVAPAYQVRGAWESFSDGVGSRETVVRVQDRYGVWTSVMVAWNDRAGIKDGFSMPHSRHQWDELLQAQKRQGMTLVPVSLDYARWSVARAQKINERSGFPLENHLDAWTSVVGQDEPDYTPPDPLERLAGLSDEERGELPQHAGCLQHEPVFESWGIEPADCRPYLERWQEAVDAADAADDESEAERLDGETEKILREVVREQFTPELIKLHRDRLVDAARKLAWLGKEHEANVAAAIVAEIDGGNPVEEMDFFLGLVASSMEMLEQMLENGEDPEALRYDPMKPVDEQG